MFTQAFSLVVWLLMCDRKTNPKKLVSADIFGSFRPTKKIKFHSSAVCLHDFVIKSAYVQPSALFKSSSVFPAVHSSFLISAFSLVSTQFCNSVILLILSWFHFIQIILRYFGLILDHFRSFLVLVTTPNASHAAASMHISG